MHPTSLPVIHNGELIAASLSVFYLEVKPTCIPKGIYIIVEEKAVSAIHIGGNRQISGLKPRIKRQIRWNFVMTWLSVFDRDHIVDVFEVSELLHREKVEVE